MLAKNISAFASKYKGAIIFLCFVLFISLILLLVYYALKREMCNCFGSKKNDEEEDGLYTDTERDQEDEIDDMEAGMLNDDLPPAVDDLPPSDVPEVVVTVSSFEMQEKKNKKKTFTSMFKKKKKTKANGHVRFDAASENTLLMDTRNTSYGSYLAPLTRSDSMESFMSGISSVTTVAEEFGEELSPARLQIYLEYDTKRWMLIAGAKQADCLVTTSKETMYWQVHITLLPFKKHRFKTRYKSSTTPVFNQNYEIENISLQALPQLSVRYRVYGRTGRAGRKKLGGECEVELANITQNEDNIIKEWKVLKRKSLQQKRESLV